MATLPTTASDFYHHKLFPFFFKFWVLLHKFGTTKLQFLNVEVEEVVACIRCSFTPADRSGD